MAKPDLSCLANSPFSTFMVGTTKLFSEMPLAAIANPPIKVLFALLCSSHCFPVEAKVRSKMVAGAPAFVFCLWLTGIVALRRCPSISAPLRGTVGCFRGNYSVRCATASLPGSLAKFACPQFYKLSPEERRVVRCLSNGTWSLPSPKCIPDCGRRSPSVSLILNGATATLGAFPWHVALYHLRADGAYEYWCGGSLVSETAVITAAHCVWEVAAERLMLALGKFHREYSVTERNVQKIGAKRVALLESYQDVGGNYNGDIAVVVLERRVRVGHHSAPVCLDWKQELVEREVAAGSSGMVVGWGLTEKETLSDGLRAVRLSVVSDEQCIAEQQRDFKKFVTYTSFCAGLRNGSGVCNGDSGGGMVFFDEGSGRWFLQGVVSVSPRRRGTPYCDPRSYTVFTKVAMFSKWLSGVTEVNGRTAGDEGKDSKAVLGKVPVAVQRLVFPHTINMLRLAGLSVPPQATPVVPENHPPAVAVALQ